MINLFMPFRAFLKFDNVCTDNNIFRLHYKATVIMLLVFTLVVTTKQFFGEPIHCMSGSEDSEKEAINNYCWIYGTYTLKSRLAGKNKAYPGVGPIKMENDEEIKHTYYQWVCFVLLGQSVMFYTPRYLWKLWEGGRLKALASDLNSPIVKKEWSEYKKSELVNYLSYTNIYTNNIYALRFAFCELLNLINVVGQIFLLDIFLGGAFRNYGAAVAAFTHTPRLPSDMENFAAVNPMDQYFPKLTKCWLKSYGPTGTLQLKDRLCVLSLNLVNEKIFLILWFWLLFLAFISLLALLYRILVLSFPHIRTALIVAQLRYVNRSAVSRIVKRFRFGDWFVLYLLGNNINPIIYRELLIELSKELDHKTVMV